MQDVLEWMMEKGKLSALLINSSVYALAKQTSKDRAQGQWEALQPFCNFTLES